MRGFSLITNVQTDPEAYPAFYGKGTGGYSLGTRQPEGEAGHSPPSIIEFTKCATV